MVDQAAQVPEVLGIDHQVLVKTKPTDHPKPNCESVSIVDPENGWFPVGFPFANQKRVRNFENTVKIGFRGWLALFKESHQPLPVFWLCSLAAICLSHHSIGGHYRSCVAAEDGSMHEDPINAPREVSRAMTGKRRLLQMIVRPYCVLVQVPLARN